MRKEMGSFLKNCKVTRHVHSPLQHYQLTAHRFEHINLDLIGPLLESGRPLKTAIMYQNRIDWPSKLPIILLGLQSAFKPDIQTTAVQLVYVTTLRLPEQFLHIDKEVLP